MRAILNYPTTRAASLVCAGLFAALALVCHDTVRAAAANKTAGAATEEAADAAPRAADVLVIGAGISGLSAAIEAAASGLSVLIVDMASVFGGPAVVSGGVLNIPVTPLQMERGIKDSQTLAVSDFLAWGEDANEPWVDYYVRHAKSDIFDWTRSLGVEYVAVVPMPGNSVPRVHIPKGGGLSLVTAIYRAALREIRIGFLFNTRVRGLIIDDGRVTGVDTANMRSGARQALFAHSVVIATGGFQSDIGRVLDNWPAQYTRPERILAGSAMTAFGSGLDLAAAAGADIERLDHQWNYVTGIPAPGLAGGERGLSLFTRHGAPQLEVWLNTDGRRFTNECLSPKFNLPRVLEQPGQRHWFVFDSRNRPNVTISRPGWTDDRLEREIVGDPGLAKVAGSLDRLAELMGLPAKALRDSIQRYNEQVSRGVDADFGRFGMAQSRTDTCDAPQAIDTPPFYAIMRYPLTRKSMGGIRTDLHARVLDPSGNWVEGLYAVGEASGFAGINGKAGLEGTFLGPAIVTGRVAGRQIAAMDEPAIATPLVRRDPFTIHEMPAGEDRCTACHSTSEDAGDNHPGYEHYDFVHEQVSKGKLRCEVCHSELFPFTPSSHATDLLRLTDSCPICHGH